MSRKTTKSPDKNNIFHNTQNCLNRCLSRKLSICLSKLKKTYTCIHTHLAQMEFQAAHKPLYGFYLLRDKKKKDLIIKLEQTKAGTLTLAGVNETHLVQLIQRPLQRKQQE